MSLFHRTHHRPPLHGQTCQPLDGSGEGNLILDPQVTFDSWGLASCSPCFTRPPADLPLAAWPRAPGHPLWPFPGPQVQGSARRGADGTGSSRAISGTGPQGARGSFTYGMINSNKIRTVCPQAQRSANPLLTCIMVADSKSARVGICPSYLQNSHTPSRP